MFKARKNLKKNVHSQNTVVSLLHFCAGYDAHGEYFLCFFFTAQSESPEFAAF